jgi:CheY-like chemotaxis protein
MTQRKKFGEILLELGVITQQDLDNALARQKVSNQSLGQIFEELGIICEKDILRILSRQFNLKKIEEINRPPVPESSLEVIDSATALAKQVFPLGIKNNKLYLATSKPLDFSTLDDLAFRTGLNVVPFLAIPSEINRAIKRFYLREPLPGEQEGRKILVVDDHDLYRRTLVARLEKEGYRVIQAENGTDALKKVLAEQPQLILLETTLQSMKGKEIFTTLQSNSLTAKIPVIGMSTRDYPEAEAQLLDMGFFDFVAKPFNFLRLLARVRRALNYSQGKKPKG